MRALWIWMRDGISIADYDPRHSIHCRSANTHGHSGGDTKASTRRISRGARTASSERVTVTRPSFHSFLQDLLQGCTHFQSLNPTIAATGNKKEDAKGMSKLVEDLAC